MPANLSTLLSDITTLKVDAIINSANKQLLGGGGVDGAIHAAAGHDLYLECLSLGGCEVGQAKLTKGYNLPARFVIHTVGPVWCGGSHGEPEMLAACYRSSLELADSLSLRSIAFPCISTGVFGFPRERAAAIAVQAARTALTQLHQIERVVFCCFSVGDFLQYQQALKAE